MIRRSRIVYSVWILVVIAAGLASRSSYFAPSIMTEFAGDTLWAAMVYLVFCVIFHRQLPMNIFIYAITFSFLIEFSQFYHEPWIDRIRDTTLGGLVLGFGFKISDLLCYSLGVSLAFLIDTIMNLGDKNKNTYKTTN